MTFRGLEFGLASLAVVMSAAPAGAQQSPSPTPACSGVGSGIIVEQPLTTTSGEEVRISLRVGGPSATYTVTLTRQDPAPAAVVRSTTVNSGTTATFTARLGETHGFTATASSSEPCYRDFPASSDFVVPVRAAVTIAATRSSTRQYSFTGRVQPAAGAVSLYRVESTGRRVLTSRADVGRDGTYRIDRRFTGSGHFGFVTVADAGSTGRHSGGTSRVRPTVIH